MKIAKKLILIGLFSSVGILLGCSKTPSGDDLANVDNTGVAEENTQENFVGTIKDLIKKEKPFVCDVSYTDDKGSTINGKIYSDGETKRTRSEMEVTVAGKTIKSFVIQDNDTTYLRSDGSNVGTKMTVKAEENNNSDIDTENGNNNGEEMNFVCKKWDIENDMLKVPSSIKFTDFSQELEKFMKK